MIPGTRKRSLQGYDTFMAAPLPPVLALPVALERQIEEATHRLGQVEMCRTLLPNADLLIYSSLRREALASSTIEGTIASPQELIQFQVSDYSERAAVREVANYSSALEWGVQQLHSYPISSRIILGLHERLLQRVRGEGGAGRYKDRQNYIGASPLAPIDAAVFVPAAPDDTPQLISQLEHYINNPENREPRVVQCALAHYQFETIHPFHDGNGRVGRLLIILHMIQLGLLTAPLIYPSVYFERRRDAYYAHLQAVRDEGAWNDWIAFFTQGIIEQCFETVTLTQMILELRSRLREQVGSVRRRASISAVLDAFFHEPVQSIRQLSDQARLPPNTVAPAIEELIALGWVYEVTGRQKGRVYACRPVLDVIFGSTTTPPSTRGATIQQDTINFDEPLG